MAMPIKFDKPNSQDGFNWNLAGESVRTVDTEGNFPTKKGGSQIPDFTEKST